MSQVSSSINHEQEAPNVKLGFISVVVSIVLLVVFYGFAKLYHVGTLSELQNTVQIQPAPNALKMNRLQETENLTQLRWVDRSAGTVQIPISVAMDNVVKSYSY